MRIGFSGTDQKILKKVGQEMKSEAKAEKQRKKAAKKAFKQSPEGHKKRLARKAKAKVWTKDYAKVNVGAAIPSIGLSLLLGNPIPLFVGMGFANLLKLSGEGTGVSFDSAERGQEAADRVYEDYDRILEQVQTEEQKGKSSLDFTTDDNY